MQGVYLEDLGLHFVKTCFVTYWDTICYAGIFIAVIIWCSFQKGNEKKMLSVYTFFLATTVFNPVLVKYLWQYLGQDMDARYYRFFWLFPVSVFLGYFCIYCTEKGRTAWHKLFYTIIIICAIILTGKPMKNTSEFFHAPDNIYKVSEDVISISSIIQLDTKSRIPRTAAPPELIMTLRQYDASIRLTLVRDIVLCWQGAPLYQNLSSSEEYRREKAIMDVIYKGDISQPDEFLSAIALTDTRYLVFSNNINIQDFLLENGFRFLAQIERYTIYATE